MGAAKPPPAQYGRNHRTCRHASPYLSSWWREQRRTLPPSQWSARRALTRLARLFDARSSWPQRCYGHQTLGAVVRAAGKAMRAGRARNFLVVARHARRWQRRKPLIFSTQTGWGLLSLALWSVLGRGWFAGHWVHGWLDGVTLLWIPCTLPNAFSKWPKMQRPQVLPCSAPSHSEQKAEAHPQCIVCERKVESIANSLGWPVLIVEAACVKLSSSQHPYPSEGPTKPEAKTLHQSLTLVHSPSC